MIKLYTINFKLTDTSYQLETIYRPVYTYVICIYVGSEHIYVPFGHA